MPPPATTSSVSWPVIAMGLVGGTALLMYGLGRLSGALRQAAGARLRETLDRLTRHRLSGFLTGISVTALTQSSTLVTVTLVGLATAGLLTVEQGIPVILGANIGTTLTAQLIAFNLAGQALWIVAAGFAASLVTRWPRVRLAGEAVLGLGLMFLGLYTLITAMAPLRTHPAVLQALAQAGHPLLGFAAGLVLAALIHSSAGVIGVVIALGAQGLLPLPAAIAVCLGAEVGTCSTALISSIGRRAAARRVALAQLLFNLAGAALSLPFVGQFAALVEPLSASPARQIANAMTLFNLVWAVVFLGFTRRLAALVSRLVPEAPEEERPLLPARYLSPDYQADPGLAFAMVRRELGRIGRRVVPLLEDLPGLSRHVQPAALARVQRLQDDVDELCDRIASYLGQLSLHDLAAARSAEFLGLMRATNSLHHIMDLLADLLEDLAEDGAPLPEAALDYSRALHAQVLAAVKLALLAVEQEDQAAALDLSAQKAGVEAQLRGLRLHAAAELSAALAAHGAERVGGAASFELAYAQLMNLLEHLKRIHYHARRCARTILPEEDAGRPVAGG
jgi:phosphate:Na+ symporter